VRYDGASIPLAGADAFRHRGGLGGTGLQVYLALSQDEATTFTELCSRTNRSPKTVRTRLRQLEELGLASKEDDGGWVALYRDLDQVAFELGTLGKGRLEKAIHQSERDDYLRAWNAERARHRIYPIRSQFLSDSPGEDGPDEDWVADAYEGP